MQSQLQLGGSFVSATWLLFKTLIGGGDALVDCLQSSKQAEVGAHYLIEVFQVMAVILLVNLLIAQMSSTYDEVYSSAELNWRFQRVGLILEYKDNREVLEKKLKLAEARLKRGEYAEFDDATVVNNHYDTDGVLSVFACTRPEEALPHYELIRAGAEAGDDAAAPAADAPADELVVLPGDTLAGLCIRYGVSARSLRRLNRLELRSTLRDLLHLQGAAYRPGAVSGLVDNNGNGRVERKGNDPVRFFPGAEG